MTVTHNSVSAKTGPRLKPIQHPNSLKLRLVYWFMENQVGKVITPLKVSYARFPESLGLLRKIAGLEEKFTVDPEIKNLINVYASTLNGCAFCVDIAKASAKMKHDMEPDIFNDLLRFEDSDRFTEPQKAVLAYVDEVTRNKHVADSTFERLQQHFNEREIVQITFLNAIQNFHNLMNAPMNIGSDKLCELWDSK